MIIPRKEFHRFTRIASKFIESSNSVDGGVLLVRRKKGAEFILRTISGGVLAYTFEGVSYAQDKEVCAELSECRLPWPWIRELGAKKTGEVQIIIEFCRVQCRWDQGGQRAVIERANEYSEGEVKLPAVPSRLSRYKETALSHAMWAAQRCISKWPIGSDVKSFICFREKEILATDGKQAFVGLGFPKLPLRKDEDVLCPPSRIFTASEFSDKSYEYRFGVSSAYVFFETDVEENRVRFWLPRGRGNYPSFDRFQFLEPRDCSFDIGDVDSRFVLKHLDGLPGKNKGDSPVLIDLSKGSIAIRGYDLFGAGAISAVELRLGKNSRYSGCDSAKLFVRREHLKNALKLGVSRFEFDPTADTILLIGIGYDCRYLLSLCSYSHDYQVAKKAIKVLKAPK